MQWGHRMVRIVSVIQSRAASRFPDATPCEPDGSIRRAGNLTVSKEQTRADSGSACRQAGRSGSSTEMSSTVRVPLCVKRKRPRLLRALSLNSPPPKAVQSPIMLYAKPRESLLRATGGAARWAREQYADTPCAALNARWQKSSCAVLES
jgi:hypothetical protein